VLQVCKSQKSIIVVIIIIITIVVVIIITTTTTSSSAAVCKSQKSIIVVVIIITPSASSMPSTKGKHLGQHACIGRVAQGQRRDGMHVLGVFENWAGRCVCLKRPAAILVATDTETHTHRQTDRDRGLEEMTPLCTHICPHPFF